MKRRKRETEVFSLSFLDCICCGFGAVLLLFVLTVGKKSDTMIDIKAKTEEIIGQMENDIANKDSELKSLQRSLTTIRERNSYATEQIEEKKKMQTELEDEFALLLAQLASTKEDLGKLLEDKESMPMQEDEAPKWRGNRKFPGALDHVNIHMGLDMRQGELHCSMGSTRPRFVQVGIHLANPMVGKNSRINDRHSVANLTHGPPSA